MRVERRQPGGIGRRGAKAGVPVGPHQNHARGGQTGPPGVARGVDDVHEPVPAAAYHEAMWVVAGLLIVCAGLVGTGCGENSPLDRPASSEELQAANDLVREYLTAAATDDGERLSSLRTVRDVRRLGGRAQCERRLAGSAFDGGRESRALERGDVKVLPADTHEVNGHIVVWADAGEA